MVLAVPGSGSCPALPLTPQQILSKSLSTLPPPPAGEAQFSHLHNHPFQSFHSEVPFSKPGSL